MRTRVFAILTVSFVGAVVVAQLVELLLPTPEVSSSNSVIGENLN